MVRKHITQALGIGNPLQTLEVCKGDYQNLPKGHPLTAAISRRYIICLPYYSYYDNIIIMKLRIYTLISLLGVVGLLNYGCGRGEEVLVRIDRKETITLTEFEERISKLPPQFQEIVNKNKKEFLDELIIDHLLYKKALERKLDEDDDVKKLFNEARKKIMMARLLKDEIEDNIAVNGEEIRDYYEANDDKFTTDETLRASHILVKTEKDAGDILVELSNGRNFEDLARARSLDPTSELGGDIGYFTRNQLVPEIEEACFDMAPGQISGVVQTKFGYHIIKLTEKKAPRVKELTEVHDSIEESLKRLKKKVLFNELVEKLKERSQITINQGLLREISSEEEVLREEP